MPFFDLLWDLDDDPEGNVFHIGEHGLTKDDVYQVLSEPDREAVSDSSGRPMAFGYGVGGEYLAVVYEVIDETLLYPVTAFRVDEA